MKLFRKTVSFCAAALILLNMAVPALAAEIQWMEVYNSAQSHDGQITTLYTGDLSFEQGDVYRFTWEGTWYHGGIGGGNIFVVDSDSEKLLFYRDGTTNGPINGADGGSIAMTATSANPKPFKFVMLFDYTGDSPKAYIDVYDVDTETIAGRLTTDISGIDGITKIYHRTWNSSNLTYERPRTGNCVMEADASKMPIPSEVDWERIKKEEGVARDMDADASDAYHDLFAGELAADTKYKLVWKTSFYKGGGVNGGSFVIEDADSSVTLFSKGKNNNIFDGSMEFGKLDDSGNPDAMVIETELDFEEGLANIKFYDDKECTKLFGQKSASLDGLDGISKIYYYMPEKGAGSFTKPQQSSIEIYKGKILPKVRSVKSVTDGEAQVLYGDGAIDLDNVKLEPVFDKILIDMNTDVDLESLEGAVTLTAKGSDVNLLSGFTQKNYVVTALVSGDILEEKEYTLTVSEGILRADGEESMQDTFKLTFKTGKKQMRGEISNPQVAEGVLTADVAFSNNADSAKNWCLVVNCYDEAGRLIWCGIYDEGEAVVDTLDATAQIELPDGAFPEGTSNVKVYLWDSLMLTEMFSDSIEISY